MKKLLSWVLTLTMCLSMFAGLGIALQTGAAAVTGSVDFSTGAEKGTPDAGNLLTVTTVDQAPVTACTYNDAYAAKFDNSADSTKTIMSILKFDPSLLDTDGKITVFVKYYIKKMWNSDMIAVGYNTSVGAANGSIYYRTADAAGTPQSNWGGVLKEGEWDTIRFDINGSKATNNLLYLFGVSTNKDDDTHIWIEKVTACPTADADEVEAALNARPLSMDNYVLYDIYPGETIWPWGYTDSGKTWLSKWTNDLSMDLSTVNINNLAVQFKVFVENNNDPGNISMLLNTSNQHMSLGVGISYPIQWDLKSWKTIDGKALTPGEWNDVVLKFSDAKMDSNVPTLLANSKTNPFTFFWFEVGGYEKDGFKLANGDYSFKLQDVQVVDLSRPADTTPVEEENLASVDFTTGKAVVTGPLEYKAGSTGSVNAEKKVFEYTEAGAGVYMVLTPQKALTAACKDSKLTAFITVQNIPGTGANSAQSIGVGTYDFSASTSSIVYSTGQKYPDRTTGENTAKELGGMEIGKWEVKRFDMVIGADFSSSFQVFGSNWQGCQMQIKNVILCPTADADKMEAELAMTGIASVDFTTGEAVVTGPLAYKAGDHGSVNAEKKVFEYTEAGAGIYMTITPQQTLKNACTDNKITAFVTVQNIAGTGANSAQSVGVGTYDFSAATSSIVYTTGQKYPDGTGVNTAKELGGMKIGKWEVKRFDMVIGTDFKDSFQVFGSNWQGCQMQIKNVTLCPTADADAVEITLKENFDIDPDEPPAPDYDTTYLVGEIPLTGDRTFTANGASTPTLLVSTGFEPIDASKHDPKKLKVIMNITAENKSDPGDFSWLANGQIELTSSGTCDVNELATSVGSFNWTEGTHDYSYYLSQCTATGGALDYSKINFMRIYVNNFAAGFKDTVHFKVNSVKIVDATEEAAMPTLFSNGMMFQQNKPMNLWGYGKDGEAVSARLLKGDEELETVKTTVPDSGRWELAFAAREGGYDTYSIEIKVGDEGNVTRIDDILIGEIWISAGQSNMELTVASDMDVAQILADAQADSSRSNIRLFLMNGRPQGMECPIDPCTDIPGAFWGRGNNPGHVARTSTLAYQFAVLLQEELDVPVGIMSTSLGATVIETWLPRDAIENDAAVKQALKDRNLYYSKANWTTSTNGQSVMYNQKVGPLAGMNIAGTLWYQGESNSNRSEIYDIELDLLKRSWGKAFGFPDGDMPLIFAQVAPYRYDNGSSNQQHLGYLGMYMEKGWKLSADTTAMVTIYDLPLDHMLDGVSSDPIHPRVKGPVAERFFIAAMNMVYGGEDEYTAPVYKNMEIKDGAIYITFDRIGDFLMTTDYSDDIHGFAIAGDDGVYVNAQAAYTDKDDTIKVWNNRVKNPKNVMYAFDNFNQGANLCNSIGFPVSPFRTVDIADTTMKPSSAIKYFTAQDWMTCDKDVWVYDSTNTEQKNTGFRPSFTVTDGATYSYDDMIFAEGAASLRVDYDDDFTLSPVLTYESIRQNWNRYNYLTVKILNAGESDVTVAFSVKTSVKTYKVKTVDGDSEVTLPAGSDKFVSVTFDLAGAAVSGSIIGMSFDVSSLYEGTVFFDAFTAGMTDAIIDEENLNEDEPIVLRDATDLAKFLEGMKEIHFATTDAAASNALDAAIANCKALLDDKDATPLQITDAISAVDDAFMAALSAATDFSALDEELELYDGLDLTKYPEDRVAAYTDALEKATALTEEKVVSQEDADAAAAAVKAAREALDAPAGLLGDVNGDEKIDSTDARLILQYYAKKIGESDLDLTLADVDGSGTVDSTDARLILQLYAKKISEFPKA